MARALLLVGLLLLGSACADDPLPYPAWYLGFAAPSCMEAWVEDAQVKDVQGRPAFNMGVGILGTTCQGRTTSWAEMSGYGPNRRIANLALPERIYVRWQSLVEPQTYELVLDIPESVRKLMLQQDRAFLSVPRVKDKPLQYRNELTLGLAPGGRVMVWVTGAALRSKPVMCVQAEVVPEGPYGGKSGGKYRPLSARARPHVDSHSIPYALWKCDKPAPN